MEDQEPNFRTITYGSEPTQRVDVSRMLPQSSGGSGGGIPLPWWQTQKPRNPYSTLFNSVNLPVTANAPMDTPYQPSDYQGPPAPAPNSLLSRIFTPENILRAVNLGRVLSNASKGSADQRSNDNELALRAAYYANNDAVNRATLQSNYAINGGRLDLDRRQFQQDEPNAQAGQAVRGSLLQNLQPLQFSGLSSRAAARMPQLNSIINAINPDARQAGGLLSQRGLSGLQSGGTKFEALPALNLPPSQLAALQQSGLLEKIMGTLGLGGDLFGALGGVSIPATTATTSRQERP